MDPKYYIRRLGQKSLKNCRWYFDPKQWPQKNISKLTEEWRKGILKIFFLDPFSFLCQNCNFRYKLHFDHRNNGWIIAILHVNSKNLILLDFILGNLQMTGTTSDGTETSSNTAPYQESPNINVIQQMQPTDRSFAPRNESRYEEVDDNSPYYWTTKGPNSNL